MASPAEKSRKPQKQPFPRVPASSQIPETVDPIWLLKAFAGVVIAALICGYLTVCLIFYQGQWQLVLHPSRDTRAPLAIAGTTIQTVHFGVDESATPQLAGWWIPAVPLARYAAYTVLYLPGGDGSLADSDAASTLAAFHALGLNVFAFDYRGFGQSAAVRPNQQRRAQGCRLGLAVPDRPRALPPPRIILFGEGVGGFLAAQLAAQHREAPAVILDSPRPDLLDVVLADPRVKSIPVRALFHERFNVAQAIKGLPTPKLLLLNDLTQNTSSLLPPGSKLTHPDSSAAPVPGRSSCTAKEDSSSGPFGSYRDRLRRPALPFLR